MAAAPGDFDLAEDELREVARYVADAAEDVLPVFEKDHPDDRRPRAAVEAAREFVSGACRSKRQRVASMDAHRAASEASREVARLAAQACGDAASAAYLHPIARAHQVGHILRAAANAARIAELAAGGDPRGGHGALEQYRARATPTLIDVLTRYPAAPTGQSRTARLVSELDTSLRRSREPLVVRDPDRARQAGR